MPSPFPGMNPYLEQKGLWLDFHQAFCTRLRDAIVPQVRPDYFVKLEEHLYIHEVGEAERVLVGRADVGVTRSTAPAPRSTVSTAATLEAPLELMVPIATDVEHVSYLEIRDRKDRTLVTVIELLSPSNKQPGDDREAFLVKRRQLIASDVHYVEIDLLRGGARMPVEPMTGCDYYVLVGRAERRPRIGFWPLTLREPLPPIPIPVREPHPDARVDLQAILHQLYDAAGYEDYVYSGLPEPRLHPADDRWAREILANVLPPKTA